MRIHGIAVYLILFGLIGVGKSFLLDGGNTGILINAIGDGKEDIDQAIARSFELVKHLNEKYQKFFNTSHISIYTSRESQDTVNALNTFNIPVVYYSKPTEKVQPLTDQSYGYGFVLRVVESLLEYKEPSTFKLISIIVSNSTTVMPTKDFRDIFNLLGTEAHEYQLLFLAKTKRLTTASSWHDLMIVGITINQPGCRLWVAKFREKYLKNIEGYNKIGVNSQLHHVFSLVFIFFTF